MPQPQSTQPASVTSYTLSALHPKHTMVKNYQVEKWVSNLPASWTEFEPHCKAMPRSASQIHENMSMCCERALELLSRLDDHEHRYRTIGLEYHRIPSNIRHRMKRNSAHTSFRLEQIFETDKPWAEQPFFSDWFTIYSIAENIFNDVQLCSQSQSLAFLKDAYKLLNKNLQRAEETGEGVGMQVVSLGLLVDTLKTTQTQCGAEDADLDCQWTTEGALLRRWVGSFVECQGLGNGTRLRVEAVTRECLVSVLPRTYWTGHGAA